jgi:hypothetical protein
MNGRSTCVHQANPVKHTSSPSLLPCQQKLLHLTAPALHQSVQHASIPRRTQGYHAQLYVTCNSQVCHLWLPAALQMFRHGTTGPIFLCASKLASMQARRRQCSKPCGRALFRGVQTWCRRLVTISASSSDSIAASAAVSSSSSPSAPPRPHAWCCSDPPNLRHQQGQRWRKEMICRSE